MIDLEMQAEPVHLTSPPIPHASPAPILLDTLFLVFLRLVFFLLSRRFLLSTLNPTLREISAPEILLPATIQQNEQPRATLGVTPMSLTDLDPEPDTDDDRPGGASPASSYPPSPAGKHLPLPPGREPFTRKGSDDFLDVHAASTTSLTTLAESDSGIELDSLGQKLKDVGSGMREKVQVLQLSHGRGPSGTKAIKKAARGLNKVARVLFSLCFAESMNLITLALLHSLGVLHARSRHVNFSVSLHILLAMVLVVVPFEQCLLLTYRSRESTTISTAPRTSALSMRSRLLISLVPFSLYVFLFTRIPPYVTTVPTETPELPDTVEDWTSGPEGWEGEGWLASSMGRLVVLGVVILGSLSGFGAVRTAWNFIEHTAGSGKRTVTEADVLQVERSLFRIRQDIMSKQGELGRFGGEGRSWVGRLFGKAEYASLDSEMRGLQAIEKQVSRSLRGMKLRKRRQDFGKTLQGRVYNMLGYVFAMYCAARLLMCLPAIFFSTSRVEVDESEPEGKGNINGDWISFLLALALSHMPISVDLDVAVWARTISLLLTGLLILSSLAQILRSLSKILRLTSKTVGAGFLLLSLGQLFATYVISLLVQLRTSLPPSPELDTDPFSPFYSNSTLESTGEIFASTPHGPDDSLLSSLPDFRVFGRLFDLTFFFTAIVTLAYRYISLKINGPDDTDVRH